MTKTTFGFLLCCVGSLAFALPSTGCDEAEDTIDCIDICTSIEACDDDFDQTECIDACEDQPENEIEACDSCLDENDTCTGCEAACAPLLL